MKPNTILNDELVRHYQVLIYGKMNNQCCVQVDLALLNKNINFTMIRKNASVQESLQACYLDNTILFLLKQPRMPHRKQMFPTLHAFAISALPLQQYRIEQIDYVSPSQQEAYIIWHSGVCVAILEQCLSYLVKPFTTMS